MAEVKLPESVVLDLEEIKPYWRNPRRIPQEAVDAVAESISRYGYQQPIVVDREHVIIVGHTRYQALKQLGYTEVPVYVADMPEEKAREYRLVDNRTQEMTSWDHDSMVAELREFEQELLDSFFPEVDLRVGSLDRPDDITPEQIDEAVKRVRKVREVNPATAHTTDVVCPACFHTFAVQTKSLPGLSYRDLEALTNGEAV